MTSGDEQAAAAAQGQVEQAVGAVGGNAALIKAALAQRGLPAGPTRTALDPPTPAQLETISAVVRAAREW
jgi:dihydrodipicolinate synthase/N-acetylneuraminate lyase